MSGRLPGTWVYDPAWPEGAPRPLYLDGCPECVKALNVPKRVQQWGDWDSIRADYRCHSCGHVWFTGWKRDPADVETCVPFDDDLGALTDAVLRPLRGDS